MATTYEPLATQTLSSSAASVTFSSISGAYTDLVIIASAQGTVGGNGMTMRLNGDTGSNYSNTFLRGNGSAASSARVANDSQWAVSNFSGIPTASFGTYIFNIFNYSNTTTNKTGLMRGNSAADGVDAIVNSWRSNAAVSSILIGTTGGNYATGSTFTLYAIKSF